MFAFGMSIFVKRFLSSATGRSFFYRSQWLWAKISRRSAATATNPSPKEEPPINPEDNLPPELQAIKPIPKVVWVTLIVTGAVTLYLIPWRSWIQHIFYPPKDEED
jgi:hypothetical protein